MPTIGVEKNAFLNGIERKEGQVTQEDLENLFFDLGLELDDIEVEGEKGRVVINNRLVSPLNWPNDR